VLFYRAALDLSRSACTFVADLIRRQRRRLGSRWRRLPPERQALLVLVHLRRNETFAGLAEAFEVGAATAHRYVTEVVDLLAELTPDLRQAADRSTQGLRHPGRHARADRPPVG
jgi:DDE superfamily endonuclease